MRLIPLFLCLLSFQITLGQEFNTVEDISKSVGGLADVIAADIDGDGDSDLVSASGADSKIAWYSNDGLGSFSEQQIISTGVRGAQAVSAADLDDDGDLDLIAAADDGDMILWIENLGLGVFGPLNIIDFPTYSAIDVLTADLDGDGDLDIVAANDNRVAWYENAGNASFGDADAITYDADDVRSIAVADLDNDGDLDVLSASYGDDKVAWYPNDGEGSFGDQQLIGTLLNANDLTTADLNGDGDQDVIASSYNSTVAGQVIVFSNLGGGSFTSAQFVPSLNNPTYEVITIDLDMDGDMDILSAQWYSHAITWHENDGSGNFNSPQNLVTELNTPAMIAAFDSDGDGDVDLVGGSRFQERIVLYSNDGSQSFTGNDVFSSDAVSPRSLSLGDLNGDLLPDVVTQSMSTHRVLWYPNLGNGAYGNALDISTVLFSPTKVAIGDMDLDGDNDVVIARLNHDEIHWFENDGNGVFTMEYSIGELDYPNDIKLGDIDNDGDLDLAAQGQGLILWYENTGGGNFVQGQIINTELGQQGNIQLSDIDADGILDITFSSRYEDLVVWHRNMGLGVFGPQNMILNDISQPRDIISADFDNDGDLDLLVPNNENVDPNLFWLPNDGDGNFGLPNSVPFDTGLSTIFYAEDLDQDGDIDIITSGNSLSEDLWLENDGTGNFTNSHVLSEGGKDLSAIAMVDMDGDNDLDIMATSSQSRVLWLENTDGNGCTDVGACNYEPTAMVEDGSCCYADCGCLMPTAMNYDPLATCESGLCEFQILGTVFFDENSNGILDGSEYGLAAQEILFLPDSLILTTNEQGQFSAVVPISNAYEIIHIADELFPFSTSPDTIVLSTVQANWNQELYFGVSSTEPLFELEVELYTSGQASLCNVPRLHNICFQNMGNVPIDGIVELEFDTLFQWYEAIDLLDSVQENHIFMSYENLLPGENICYDILLQMPTVEYIGETLLSIARVYGYSEDSQVSYGEDSLEVEVTCAYDPNDKQVFPAGFTDAHYVPDNEDLEYLVRFQNTGNAPATDVIIRDTIAEGLDISSFQLVANSHSVFTTVDPQSREVEFYFQDIQLPDSVNNEPESHGLVSYRIRPEEGLPLLTELNNTAHIFFDNNPAIVTNTTWSTTYDCSLFTVEFTQDGAILTASEGDSYQWYLDGEAIDGATAPIFEAFLNGEYAVEISNGFPCTALTSSVYVLVNSLDELTENPISLFPNPMSQEAILDLGELRGELTLEVYDVKGQLIRSEVLYIESGILNLERERLFSGQYLLRLSNADTSYELPFIVE